MQGIIQEKYKNAYTYEVVQKRVILRYKITETENRQDCGWKNKNKIKR